ncbi:hypothetical protein [Rahnella]|uniref:hypothetical protein n=1 Tax=Rahnella TaxID=34037 RepID=UPI000F4F959C|nr:hypothetical protein [Rahnella]
MSDKKHTTLSEIFSFEIKFTSFLAPVFSRRQKKDLYDALQRLASDFGFYTTGFIAGYVAKSAVKQPVIVHFHK